MPACNLIEYSKNCSKTSESLWNYYRDQPTDDDKINHYLKSKSFDYKSSGIEIDDENKSNKENVEIALPLKYLNNFWRNLDIPLFSCEVIFILTWSKDCVVLRKAKGDAVAATKLSAENVSNVVSGVNVSTTNVKFQKQNCMFQ